MALRVLYVHNGLGTGGAERSLAEMLPGLISQGIDPTIACLYPRSEGVEEDVRHNVAIRFLRSRRLLGRVAGLRRMISGFRPDLIHTTIAEANFVGRFAAIGTGVPVLTSLVNTPYAPVRFQDPNIRPLLLRAVRVLDRATAPLSAHFHAITHAVKQDAVLVLGIPPERITVIERGRDARRLGQRSLERRRQVRSRLGLDQDADIIINVARQEFQKGQSYLLDAFEAVAHRFPAAVLLMVGRTGAATRDLQRRHEAHPARSRVHFLGHRDDVPDLLAAADLFAFPSLFEGLGGVLIEAMALGLPIVASDVPAIREVVEPGHNALLVPPASAQEIAAAVSTLLSDAPRRRDFGLRGRDIFEDRFMVERSTLAMAKLYEHLVMSRCQRSPRPAVEGHSGGHREGV